MSPEMRERIKEALKFKQITLLAPSDQIFESMAKRSLLKLYSSVDKLKDFLRKHIYLGVLDKDSVAPDVHMLAQPIESKNSIAVMHAQKGNTMVTNSENETFKLSESIRVKEGMLIVEDMV